MQDNSDITGADLLGQDWQGWLDRAEAAVGDDGYMQPLGANHAALFCERKPVLLVTFENFDRIEDISDKGQPFGWTMLDALGWSHMCLLSRGDTWFRDARVYGYFDRLIDDGFFDEFEQVIFYGAGACGYAAAAFSVAAPGAKVLMLRPQATLDPRVAEWDDRYLAMRRTSFTDRYGYAPDMLDAADTAVLLYDPEVEFDAMHSALFNRANVLRFRTRHLGYSIEETLAQMGLLQRMLAQLSAGRLTRRSLAQLWRKRRDEQGYLFALLRRLAGEQRDALTVLFCENVLARKRGGPRYRNALSKARARLDVQDG
ncbi:phosphoadenosine phosphosulfate reductase [Roseovarius ramblicola]|uniref:Phosphoadenosine phosphosulfate reductase n=1 Tax=Roseovarius ramblicola TaxID=2022336 RepID=A0ABV5HYK7_9RHOB